MVTAKLMTADDLAHLPRDGFRYELIRGELRRMSPTGYPHAMYLSRIHVPLALYVDEQGLGDVLVGDPGFVLESGPDTVLRPDIAFVRAARVPPDAEQVTYARLAPDLVIEVLSPSNRPGEVAEKIAIYHRTGVPVVWLFDPRRRRVLVHVAGIPPLVFDVHQTLDGGDVLPGFQLRLADVFR